MDRVNAFACECGIRLPDVPAWPVHCRCGRVAGQEHAIPVPVPIPKTPPQPTRIPQWLADRLTICRTQCPHYLPLGDRCGIQAAKNRPGHLTHMITHPRPDGTCPADPPLWAPVPGVDREGTKPALSSMTIGLIK